MNDESKEMSKESTQTGQRPENAIEHPILAKALQAKEDKMRREIDSQESVNKAKQAKFEVGQKLGARLKNYLTLTRFEI